MTRTTLAIDPEVLRQLKRRAADERRSVQDLVNQLLRQALVPIKKPLYRLRLRGWSAALQPGIDLADRDTYLDLIEPLAPYKK